MRPFAIKCRFLAVCTVSMSTMFLIGCSTNVKASYAPTFQPQPGTTVRLGQVVDAAPMDNRGDKADLDIANEMRRELEASLKKAGLLASSSSMGTSIGLSIRIDKYDPGNAFARWLLPGAGATKLSIVCTLSESGREVGTIKIARSVAMGGGYTIGEWKKVFKTVAAAVVKELKKKLKQ